MGNSKEGTTVDEKRVCCSLGTPRILNSSKQWLTTPLRKRICNGCHSRPKWSPRYTTTLSRKGPWKVLPTYVNRPQYVFGKTDYKCGTGHQTEWRTSHIRFDLGQEQKGRDRLTWMNTIRWRSMKNIWKRGMIVFTKVTSWNLTTTFWNCCTEIFKLPSKMSNQLSDVLIGRCLNS